MLVGSYLSSFEEISDRSPRSVIIAFSGGLDSCYAACRLRELLPASRIVASTVDLTGNTDFADASERAQQIGVEHVVLDGSELFQSGCEKLVVHNAQYNNMYVISSSISRPVMASCIQRFAMELDRPTLVHCATHTQNSAARFELAWSHLCPQAVVGSPFAVTTPTRAEKREYLERFGVEFGDRKYSIDETPIARVVESGPLENPERPIPGTGVFAWTQEPNLAPDPIQLDLVFEEGLPVEVCGRRVNSMTAIELLNTEAGRYGIGRSSGLEQTPYGVKSHEVREAPGATVLLLAHRALENAVLSESETTLKNYLDQIWTNQVVAGHWFGLMAQSVDCASRSFSEIVSGQVSVMLSPGAATVSAITADSGLYHAGFHEQYVDMVSDVRYSSFANLRTLTSRRRRKCTLERGSK